ncbi:hypothetical protein [Georgenia sp. SUBG003]|uniref:hypothetical protein n=1 Tax=Georgenia sp. SUBG003 TaxID=1497974 RepID=UPI0004D45AB8|nr:hypothetical protein DA06_19190 [Georgenia sp. SUBG003]
MDDGSDDAAPWITSLRNFLPGVAPVAVLLARGSDVVVAISTVRCFPAGIEINLIVHAQHPGPDLFDQVSGYSTSEDHLQWTVTYPDGATAVAGADVGNSAPETPVVIPLYTSGSAGESEAEVTATFWLSPLPPAGTLRFLCSWPGRDIPPVTTELDTEPLLEAAGRAAPLSNV